jgi:hypothetical protein
MKTAGWASLVIPLFVAGLGQADPCGSCQCPIPPITLVTQPPPQPTRYGPMVCLPAPVLFQQHMTPSQFAEAPPSHPITLFQMPPPPVHVYGFTPPPISICTAYVHPPQYAVMPPNPGIVLYEQSIRPLEYGPTLPLPPITLVNQPQPPGPNDLGTVCSYGCQGQPTPPVWQSSHAGAR